MAHNSTNIVYETLRPAQMPVIERVHLTGPEYVCLYMFSPAVVYHKRARAKSLGTGAKTRGNGQTAHSGVRLRVDLEREDPGVGGVHNVLLHRIVSEPKMDGTNVPDALGRDRGVGKKVLVLRIFAAV